MIGGLLRDEIARFLGRAVDVGGDALTERPFPELADAWRAMGLRPGDLVLLSLPTGVALLQHFFGVLAAGGVPALLAPGTPSARLRELATVMGARALGAVRLPGAGLAPERVAPLGCIEVAWFPPTAEPAAREGEVVMLTSGTSGFASGCVTSIEAMLRNGSRHADAVGQRADDTVLVSLPLHFSFAMVAQALATLGRGGNLVIAGPPFNQEAYARAIAARGVTISSLSPTQVRQLLHHGGALPESLRVLSVGGDSLAPEHVGELLRARPRGELYLTYGLTQAGPRVSTLAAHAEPASRHASVGRPLADTTVLLEPLDDGSGRTELLVSSDTLMRRRIGVVEGRRGEDFRRPGVLATGDVFEQDESGCLFYRGRLSEYILRGGEKICLATVRRLATRLPGVITARTRTRPGTDGEDFDLLLLVADTPDRLGPDQYRAQLARTVRRSELPHGIDVVTDPGAGAFGYK
jgi:acyl-CoA synthetase (AMP-forming)/AMP-acid ligase II